MLPLRSGIRPLRMQCRSVETEVLRSPEMFAARIALLTSTVSLVNACTNGTPQWDEATWHIAEMFRVFGRLLEVAS